MKKSKLLLIIYLLVFWSLSFNLRAEVIKDIVIKGTERVNVDYVKSLLNIKKGDNYDKDAVIQSIKNLYDTDRFKEVNIEFNNSILIYKIIENPIISKISFEGNKEIKKDDLKKEIYLTEGDPYSEIRLNIDKKKIEEAYSKVGYLTTSVTTKVEQKDYNRVELTYIVKEGKKSVIKNITFHGNKHYSSMDLKSVIVTKESRFWRFLTPNDVYDENRIIYDGELLKQFYLENGYINFALISSYVEIANNGDFELIFNMEEGERYKFGKVDIDIKIIGLEKYHDELLALTKLDDTKGTWFSRKKVNRIILRLKNKLSSLGYNFNNITPIYKDNAYFKIVDITLNIEDAKESVIKKVNITGNSKTYEEVIRRQMKLSEGSVYDDYLVSQARTDIYNLGYFSAVDITNQPDEEEGKTDINIKVEEQSTGYLSLGGGYSTVDGFLLEGKYSENNLWGRGWPLNLVASYSDRELNFDVSLANPYLFDRKIYGEVGAFSTETDNTDESSYELNEQGFRLSMGYFLTDHIKQRFTYKLSFQNIFDVSDDASIAVKDSAGQKISSMISHHIELDKRDNVIYPTKGYWLQLDTDVSGLGGNVFYLRNTATASFYRSLYGDIVLSAIGSVGEINKINPNNDILIFDKFYLGGDLLRGFEWAGVGPRDPSTGDSLGGDLMFRASFQVDFPIPVVENFGLLFHIFSDNGTVADYGNSFKSVIESSPIRSSAGFGLSWRSPFGLITLDWGWPVKKEEQDETQVFLLSFGTRF